jgi:hypothetical protein
MQNSNHINEKSQRIKYIRVLEKFFNRNIALLRLDSFDFELYKQRMLKNFEQLEKTEAIGLHSNYLVGLKAYIQAVMNSLNQTPKEFEQTKQELLKQANSLQKEKNKSSYKKEKHRHKKFDDGY